MARILELVLNGRRRVDAVPDNLLLLDYLREVVGLGPAFVDINETKSVVRASLNLRFGYAAPGANH